MTLSVSASCDRYYDLLQAATEQHLLNTMNVYQQNGFEDREEYLNSLREEYGTGLVDALTSVLPASEDFDGLITELEDNFQGFGGDFANGFDLFG